MKIIGQFVTVIFAAVVNNILLGWAGVKLWTWFVFPICGIPSPHIALMIGLALTIRFINGVSAGEPAANMAEFWKTFRTKAIIGVTTPLAAVGIGKIITWFI